MNYYPVTDGQTDGQTDRRTESDAYEPTVQYAQVGSKITKGLRRYTCTAKISLLQK